MSTKAAGCGTGRTHGEEGPVWATRSLEAGRCPAPPRPVHTGRGPGSGTESVIWPSLSPRHVLALPAVPAAVVAPGTLGPESSGNLSCGQSRRTRVLGLWREAGPGGIWEMVLGPEWPTGGMAGPGIGDQLQGGRERMGNADRGRRRKAGRGGAGRKGGAYGRPARGGGARLPAHGGVVSSGLHEPPRFGDEETEAQEINVFASSGTPAN